MVLLILAVLWAFVLVPPLLRNRAGSRSESKRIRALRRFRRRLTGLAPALPARRHADASRPPGAARPHVALIARPRPNMTAPAGEPPTTAGAEPAPETSREEVLCRRRRQLVLLLGAMGATLVLGVLPPLRALWSVHLVLDAICAGYVVWLRREHRARLSRLDTVRYLPTAAPASGPDPERLEHVELRRSATSS